MIGDNRKYKGLAHIWSLIIDLLIINSLAYFLPYYFRHPALFHTYISAAWIIISFRNEFYEVYRYTKITQVLKLLLKQFILFFLILYAYIGFFKQPRISRLYLASFFVFVCGSILILKFARYIVIRKYRKNIEKDLRKVVVIGKNEKTKQLIEVFKDRKDFGFNFKKNFTAKSKGNILKCLNYIIENDIDEIYCSIDELSDEDIITVINFSDRNFKTVKFIPDNRQIFSKKLNFEYYGYAPVLSLKVNPLAERLNPKLKRAFDVVFSSLVILLILSWLTPIIALMIRIESKGPIYFKQMRKGSDFNLFPCYKFRSMAANKNSDFQQATKNDMRITRVGAFLRKTSMDELPQFYNVLFGHMSVVGPRPLMISHTEDYMDKIDKFMLRHHVKPGITGLAQTKGYRGEIEVDSDMKNRVRLDVFYVENWSLILDFRIIIQTVLNIFQGEEKAY